MESLAIATKSITSRNLSAGEQTYPSSTEHEVTMATQHNVSANSHFCRACGGPTTTFGGITTCANTTTIGQQQIAQDHCANVTMHNRLFCEHCGHPLTGPQWCPNPTCGLPP